MSPLTPEESLEDDGKRTIHLGRTHLQSLIDAIQDPSSTPEGILRAQEAIETTKKLSGKETVQLSVEEILRLGNTRQPEAVPAKTKEPDPILPMIEEIQDQLDTELPSRRNMYAPKPDEEEVLRDPRTTDTFFLTPRHQIPLKIYYWYEGVTFRIVHDTIEPFQKPQVKGKLPKHQMVTKIGNLLPAFYHAFENNNFWSKHPFSFETILKSLRWKFEKPKLYIPARISHMIGVLWSDEEFVALTEKELRKWPGWEAYQNVDTNIIQTEITQILRDIQRQDSGEDIFSINGEIGVPMTTIYFAVHEAFSAFINKHWHDDTNYHFFNLNTLFYQEGVNEEENATVRAFLQDEDTWQIMSAKLQEFLPNSSAMQNAMILGIRCMLEWYVSYNEKVFLHPLDADPKKHMSPVWGTIESRAAFVLDESDIPEEEESDSDEDLVKSGRYTIFPDGYGKIYETRDASLYGKHTVSLSIPGTRSSVRIPGASAQTNMLPPLHMHGHHFVYKDTDGTGYVFDNLRTSIQKFKKIGTVEEIRRDDGSIADVVFTVYDGDLESIYSLEKQSYIL